jgi:hypothetical protein
MLGWGDNNNDDAGLLPMLTVALLLFDGFVIFVSLFSVPV